MVPNTPYPVSLKKQNEIPSLIRAGLHALPGAPAHSQSITQNSSVRAQYSTGSNTVKHYSKIRAHLRSEEITYLLSSFTSQVVIPFSSRTPVYSISDFISAQSALTSLSFGVKLVAPPTALVPQHVIFQHCVGTGHAQKLRPRLELPLLRRNLFFPNLHHSPRSLIIANFHPRQGSVSLH